MSSALTLPLDLTAGAGLSSYLRTVNGAPLLTVEEEQELARRYFSENDLEAARQLVFPICVMWCGLPEDSRVTAYLWLILSRRVI